MSLLSERHLMTVVINMHKPCFLIKRLHLKTFKLQSFQTFDRYCILYIDRKIGYRQMWMLQKVVNVIDWVIYAQNNVVGHHWSSVNSAVFGWME